MAGAINNSRELSGIKDHCFWEQEPAKVMSLKFSRSKGAEAKREEEQPTTNKLRERAAKTLRSLLRDLPGRMDPVIFPELLWNMLTLLFDEFHQGFFHYIRKRSVLLAGNVLEPYAEPFGAFFREINVQMGHNPFFSKQIQNITTGDILLEYIGAVKKKIEGGSRTG